jgi:hypothetical protein
MAIPELEQARVETELRRFCDRVPPHARSQVWYEFTIRGNSVTLLECRPYFRDPAKTTKSPFARFDFDPQRTEWSLKCSDRNDHWHLYGPTPPTRRFSDLVAEVERDPTCIFLG